MNYDKDKISRLLTYKNLLYRFKTLGFIRVFSDNLADTLGVSASLIRKDFAYFGIRGNQKGGYHIDSVLDDIREFIGFNKEQKVVLIGVGRIGEALIKYEGFSNESIAIVAGFDNDRNKINENGNPPILHMECLEEYLKKNTIKTAILAVPGLVAQAVVEILKSTTVEGILNFTPIKLKSTDNLLVRNINIEHELASLIYSVKNLND
jgi:redox-sensing transcriptional repressor